MWFPISSAPNDRAILGLDQHDNYWVMAWQSDTLNREDDECYSGVAGWCEHGEDVRLREVMLFWMELPPLPYGPVPLDSPSPTG